NLGLGHILHHLDRDDDPAFLRLQVVELRGRIFALQVGRVSTNDDRGDAPVARTDYHSLDAPEEHVRRVYILLAAWLEHALPRGVRIAAWPLDDVDDAAHLRHAGGNFFGGVMHVGVVDLAGERHQAVIGLHDDAL